MTTTELLEKLNRKYATAPFTKLANAGQFADAAEQAARYGMWGIWEQINEACGLPFDSAAREQWLSAFQARRAAKYASK